MKADPTIQAAIEGAVREAGQGDDLARKLVAWFTEVASGNEDIGKRTSARRHAELLYGATDHAKALPSCTEAELRAIEEDLSNGDQEDAA